MKREVVYIFDRDEAHSMLQYQLIASTVGSPIWNTGSIKRKCKEKFSDEELERIPSIYKRCTNWYLVTGLPDKIKISEQDFSVWLKLIAFCGKDVHKL